MDPITAAKIAQQVAEGIEQRAAARAQAKIVDQNANASVLAGEAAAMASLRRSRQQLGMDIAAAAGGGNVVGDGSVYDLLYQQGIEDQMQALNLRYKGQSQAYNQRQQASDLRRAGDTALVKSIFGGVSTAILGAGNANSHARLQQQRAAERRSIMVDGGIPVPEGD